MNANDTVYYCYAVTRAANDEDRATLRGVQGARVEPISWGELVAITSPVPADEFDEAAVHTKLENLTWLEDVARAHNTVVDHVARQAVTLPFRLATIYWSPERVRDVLRHGQHRLTAALNRIDGRREWGVKVYTAATANASPSSHTDRSESGRAYLRQRLRHRDARDESLRHAEDSAVRIDDMLSQSAEDRRRHRPQNAELSGAHGQNVFNAAYLVHADNEQHFTGQIDQLREQNPQCRIELTGPWVPYSFALDAAAEDDARD